MEENIGSDASATVVQEMKEQIKFQRRWQNISSTAYVACTVSILAFSSGATLAASSNWANVAAYLAAATTVLVGFEKSMLFREKWKFHLGVATKLLVLDSKWSAKIIAQDKLVEEYANILQSYADNLPIANRDNT